MDFSRVAHEHGRLLSVPVLSTQCSVYVQGLPHYHLPRLRTRKTMVFHSNSGERRFARVIGIRCA